MKRIALFALFASLAGAATATPIVTYTVSGSAGNYTLDFTLTNNISASYTQSLYFFGVNLADTGQGSPSGWIDWGGTWNNSGNGYGGSNIDYDSTWITFYDGASVVGSGESLSGFTVNSTFLPTLVNFYSYGYNTGSGPNYDESDAFYKGYNPGFEGVANGASVAEPLSLSLLGVGLLALRLGKRKVTA